MGKLIYEKLNKECLFIYSELQASFHYPSSLDLGSKNEAPHFDKKCKGTHLVIFCNVLGIY